MVAVAEKRIHNRAVHPRILGAGVSIQEKESEPSTSGSMNSVLQALAAGENKNGLFPHPELIGSRGILSRSRRGVSPSGGDMIATTTTAGG